jgi:hypothetical protein
MILFDIFLPLPIYILAFQEGMNDPFLRMRIISGSVYEQCLPNNSLDLGVCTFVVQWFSE